MNYRHAYHAGNFADVVKHAVLCRVLAHLREKPAAFRVIDTHAGAGRYDLAGPEAGKTQEWRDGIGRLLRRGSWPPPIRALLAPYLDAVAALNPDGRLATYPGSPVLAQALLRRQDRLIACELEPRRGRRPRTRAAPATPAPRRSRSTAGPRSPPTCRRRAARRGADRSAVRAAGRIRPPGASGWRRRTANGRPASTCSGIRSRTPAEVQAFARGLARLGIAKMLRVELILPTAGPDTGLRGSGLIAVNPPWTLHDELKLLLPALAEVLSRGATSAVTLDWLAGKSAS